MGRDNIFLDKASVSSFEFNGEVANVFDDMLNRSVPFYRQILLQISQLISSPAMIYDLGCSLGGLIPYLKSNHDSFNYIGIDQSPEMIAKAKHYEASNITFLEADISKNVAFDHPTAIICNLVLQFIDPEVRERCINDYFHALPAGGELIIVEKVRQQDPDLQNRYTKNYHALKRENGYSDEEIINKDRALENVLKPETLTFYEDTLAKVGFSSIDIFFKWYNFVGLIAKR